MRVENLKRESITFKRGSIRMNQQLLHRLLSTNYKFTKHKLEILIFDVRSFRLALAVENNYHDIFVLICAVIKSKEYLFLANHNKYISVIHYFQPYRELMQNQQEHVFYFRLTLISISVII